MLQKYPTVHISCYKESFNRPFIHHLEGMKSRPGYEEVSFFIEGTTFTRRDHFISIFSAKKLEQLSGTRK